uniref:Uncharacterized protein n=1 Tax=Ditylenchus dipsaci TaxID=166011 RepID=A0A915EWC7_9BILA
MKPLSSLAAILNCLVNLRLQVIQTCRISRVDFAVDEAPEKRSMALGRETVAIAEHGVMRRAPSSPSHEDQVSETWTTLNSVKKVDFLRPSPYDAAVTMAFKNRLALCFGF